MNRDQGRLEPAKWLALAAMTLDHGNKLLLAAPVIAPYQAGRLAFPLFAWIIACRLAALPELAGPYLRRIGLWALISQTVYVLAFGRPWYDLNIFSPCSSASP